MEAQDEQEAGWSPGGVSMFSSYTATGSIIDELSPTKFLGGREINIIDELRPTKFLGGRERNSYSYIVAIWYGGRMILWSIIDELSPTKFLGGREIWISVSIVVAVY
jgi:hypothetical protein